MFEKERLINFQWDNDPLFTYWMNIKSLLEGRLERMVAESNVKSRNDCLIHGLMFFQSFLDSKLLLLSQKKKEAKEIQMGIW